MASIKHFLERERDGTNAAKSENLKFQSLKSFDSKLSRLMSQECFQKGFYFAGCLIS